MSYPVRNREHREQYINPHYHKIKRTRRNLQARKMAKIRFFIILAVIFSFILPRVFSDISDQIFLRRIINSQIVAPKDLSFLNSAESTLTNDYFLDSNFLGNVNLAAPIMEKPHLTSEMTRLATRLKALTAQYPSLDTGIFIWDYSSGKYVNINADKAFPTASIIKLPILCQLFRRAEMGLIHLDEKINLTDYYVTGGSGYLQYKPLGTQLTVENLAQLMIQESDNTATNMLLSSIGGVNDLNRNIRLWGFNNTHLSNWLPDLDGTNVATPEDLGTILYNIDNPDFLTLPSRARIVDIMSHVKNRFLIQAGLPDGVQFIHKTGDIGTMLGDAGVVLLPNGKRYIIVIMVKRPWNSYTAKQLIIDLSKTTYNSYVSNDF